MIIMSSDDKRYVDVGSEDIWYSVLSTAEIRLAPMKKDIRLALDFLNTGKCSAMNAHETARQFNLIRDAFSQIDPSNAVYNKDKPSMVAPWINNLKLYNSEGSVEIQTSDPSAIIAHLDETGRKSADLFKTLLTFISKSRFNFFGSHSIQCPQCKSRPTSKMENFYPLEIQTIFFGLCSRLWLAGR